MFTGLYTLLELPYIIISATDARLLLSFAVAVGIARLPWWEMCVAITVVVEVDAPYGCEWGRERKGYAFVRQEHGGRDIRVA